MLMRLVKKRAKCTAETTNNKQTTGCRGRGLSKHPTNELLAFSYSDGQSIRSNFYFAGGEKKETAADETGKKDWYSFEKTGQTSQWAEGQNH